MRQKLAENITHLATGLVVLLVFLLAISRAGADIAVSVIAVLFLAHSFLTKNWQWVNQKESITLLFLATWVAFATAVQTSFSPDTWVAAAWVRFVLLYLALRFWLWTDPARLERFAPFAWIALLLVSVDTYTQYVTGTSLSGHPKAGERLTGPLSVPNIGAYFVHFLFPVCALMLHLWQQQKKPFRATMGIVSTLFLIALIPLTGERSSTLSLLAGLGVAVLIVGILQIEWRRYVFAFALLLVVLAVLVSSQPIVEKRIMDFREHVSNLRETPYGQLFLGGIHAWKTEPHMGIGARQYPKRCESYLADNIVTYCDRHPHQMYIQWLAETGLIGCMLFLGFIGVVLISVWRHRNTIDPVYLAGGLAGMMTVLFPFVASQSNFSNWPAGLMWFSLALSVSLLSHRKHA